MNYQSNPQLELAFDYVSNTNRNIFLTGRAGTGKTTFLQRLRQAPVKRMAVVAPTGVAAINAGGMTIHSLFQLPFGMFLPEKAQETARQRRFTNEKIRLIRSLDLLVIDEISMVRADLLDAVDDVLRRYKDRFQPFGGVQLLMIGDLHQLPPVVRDEEWEVLRKHYETPYFFSSQALRQTNPVAIELQHIYRQSDNHFIELLNKIRDNQLDDKVLTQLNSRYIPHFQAPPEEAYITLTSHNAAAQTINARNLASIPGKAHLFKAEIIGDFPAQAHPTEAELELKVGAQVMFVKNDASREKRYFNGKIGQIVKIKEDVISIQCPNEETPIEVSPAEWTNVRYTLDETSKEVTEEVLGAFRQYPLQLAWAITIHKSQGLTFDRAIIDAQAAFAHGQVYVALSRCRSFEGIVLCSPITYASVRTDTKVRDFTTEIKQNPPDVAHLQQAKSEFQKTLLLELFGSKELKRHLEQAKRTLLSHENVLHADAIRQFKQLTVQAEADFITVADKFRMQLQGYFAQPGLPEKNAALQERVRKACAWFSEKIVNALSPALKTIEIVTDNKTVRKTVAEALENLERALFVQNACLTAMQNGFSTTAYLRAKADAQLDFQAASAVSPLAAAFAAAPKSTTHPELYALLKKWRDDVATAQAADLYEILPTRALLEIVEMLPANLPALRKVRGIGEAKSRRYGAAILEIVRNYCERKGLGDAQLMLPEPETKPKADTKQQSFNLFQAGKTIPEIAQERNLTVSTIEGHLGHFVELGQLDIFELMEAEKVRAIEQLIAGKVHEPLATIKAQLGEAYSYREIRLVICHLKRRL